MNKIAALIMALAFLPLSAAADEPAAPDAAIAAAERTYYIEIESMSGPAGESARLKLDNVFVQESGIDAEQKSRALRHVYATPLEAMNILSACGWKLHSIYTVGAGARTSVRWVICKTTADASDLARGIAR